MAKQPERRRDFGTRSYIDAFLHSFRVYHERRVVYLEARLQDLEQRLEDSEKLNLAKLLRPGAIRKRERELQEEDE